jgi:hypothetical protein
MKKIISLFIVLASLTSKAQNQPRYYFKDSEMGGFPSALKLINDYTNISSQFTYFNLDEALYNAIFYKSAINEGGNGAKFRRFDLVFPRKMEIEPLMFPNYKLVLNPKLEKGYFSKHRFLINIRYESVSADFETDAVEWDFPENILITKTNTPAKVLVNVEHVEFHNDGELNQYHGIILKGIKGFSLEPSVIANSFIELTDCKTGEFRFLAEEAYDYPNLVFENMRLCWFLQKYGHINPGEYKSSLELKQVQGKINIGKSIGCEVSEIYFFGNSIAGVLTFPVKERENLLEACNYMKKNTVNWSGLKLNEGKLPTFSDVYQNTTILVKEDFKTIKMYFLIIK